MVQMLRGKHLSITDCKRGVLLLLALLLVVVPSAQARPLDHLRSGAPLMLAELDSSAAARLVESRTGGKVLSVHRQENKGKTQYRVKVLLPEGRVRTIMVDAQSGRMGG